MAVAVAAREATNLSWGGGEGLGENVGAEKVAKVGEESIVRTSMVLLELGLFGYGMASRKKRGSFVGFIC